jgi:hypothetical protein
MQAGIDGVVMRGLLEKSDLLACAKAHMQLWECRRLVLCGQLAASDASLRLFSAMCVFRIPRPTPQQSLVGAVRAAKDGLRRTRLHLALLVHPDKAVNELSRHQEVFHEAFRVLTDAHELLVAAAESAAGDAGVAAGGAQQQQRQQQQQQQQQQPAAAAAAVWLCRLPGWRAALLPRGRAAVLCNPAILQHSSRPWLHLPRFLQCRQPASCRVPGNAPGAAAGDGARAAPQVTEHGAAVVRVAVHLLMSCV